MTKQYVRYICKHIIFTVIIWLCVLMFMSSTAMAYSTIETAIDNEVLAYDHYNTHHRSVYNIGMDVPTTGGMLVWGLGNAAFTSEGCRTYHTIYKNTTGHDLCSGIPLSTYRLAEGDCVLSMLSLRTGSGCYYNGSSRNAVYRYGQSAGGACGSTPVHSSGYSCKAFYLSPTPSDRIWANAVCSHSCLGSVNHNFKSYFLFNQDETPFTFIKYLNCSETVYVYINASSIEYVLAAATGCAGLSTHYLNLTLLSGYTYRIHSSETGNTYINESATPLSNTTINLSDDCGNPLVNATTTVFKNMVDQIYYGNENPITINEAGNYERYDQLNVFIDTHDMAVEKTVYADDEFNNFNLFHDIVDWDLHTYVYDESDNLPINNVKVSHFQECRIHGYESNTQGFTNVYGFITSPCFSNQNFTVKCEKEGYITFEYEYEANFDAWNPIYRINIRMAPDGSGSGNTTLPDLPCQIGWADDTGILISEIDDTENARLYYIGGNCSNVLKLEKRDTVNHVWDLIQIWDVSAKESGYKQFTSANWTEGETTRYRGILTGYTCGCAASTDLKVVDSLDPQTVTNLTAGCFFRHTLGGSLMNPSSPVHILSYASSNNSTLVDIRLDLYNETVLVDTITYGFFDYYVSGEFIDLLWEPNYQYAAGFNYSVYMYCVCENVLVDLDTCYTNATGDNPFNTGNALTVKVYDQSSYPLQHSTVYVESWGTLDTGATNEVMFSGLGDDTYEYRAIKGGYLDRGFYSITLTSDATVSYILDIIDTEHAVRDIRLSDNEIKDMLVPVVFFILILLLVGVLIDAVN